MGLKLLILLPFIASALYGLCYVLMEKVVGIYVSPASFLAVNTVANIAAILFLVAVHNDTLDLKEMLGSVPVFLMVVAAASAPAIGWVMTVYSIKNISALYTALAETSYPLFTIIFGFLLFGIREMNWVTFCGGMMILVGAAIMVYSKAQIEAHD